MRMPTLGWFGQFYNQGQGHVKVKDKLSHMYVKVLCQESWCPNIIEIYQGIKKLLQMLVLARRTDDDDRQPGYDNSSTFVFDLQL